MAKPRRAEKLIREGILDGAEVEALRKVSRSVRGFPERVAESEVQSLRRELDELFLRLGDAKLEPINPIRSLRELLGLSQVEMAAVTSYSLSRYASIESGAIVTLPSTLIRVVIDLFGPAAPATFECAWNRFRSSLTEDARRAAEKKLFPLGSGHMVA